MSGWVRLECGLQYELPVIWDTGRDWLKYQVVLIATILQMTWLAWYMFSCTCYCSLSCIRYHVTCILVTLPGTCYTFACSALHIFCFLYSRHHDCICTIPYCGYIAHAHMHVHIAYAHLHVHFYHVTTKRHYFWYKLDTTIDLTRW